MMQENVSSERLIEQILAQETGQSSLAMMERMEFNWQTTYAGEIRNKMLEGYGDE